MIILKNFSCPKVEELQDELRRNGSGAAVIETNEERSYFLIEIPCREGFEDEPLNGTINGTINGMIIYDIKERESDVLTAIANSPNIKKGELAERLDIAIRTLSRSIQILSSEPYSLIEYHGVKKQAVMYLQREVKPLLNQWKV